MTLGECFENEKKIIQSLTTLICPSAGQLAGQLERELTLSSDFLKGFSGGGDFTGF